VAKALIVGAGAIGRGYLPWELKNFEITFYDHSLTLISDLQSKGGYHTYMTFGNRLEAMYLENAKFCSDVNELVFNSFDIAIICVGPRNLRYIPSKLAMLRCPLFSLENDSKTVQFLREHLNKADVYFGVPDVITSFTASPKNLEYDSNALHTENGVLYLEDSCSIPSEIKAIMPGVQWVDKNRMTKEWDAKLYIHNTPHCIAAFYGYLHNCEYVHEALEIPDIRDTLVGVIDEVLQTLKIVTNHDHDFLEWYAEKEVIRFSNTLLFDPVCRVAREPLRKLAPKGRLVGIMRLAIGAGVIPINIAKGVASALKYDNPSDPDSIFMHNIEVIGLPAFLSYMVGISPQSVEAGLIIKAFENFRVV
jgi:mannitol-1-phosphate 5-dehydrogenase